METPDPIALLRQAMEQLQRGQFAAAADLSGRALALLPDHPAGLHTLGLARAQSGDLAGAISCFQRCCEVAPDNTDAPVNLALALSMAGRNAEAEVSLRRVLDRVPNHEQAFPMLRNVLRALCKEDASHAEVFDFIYATNMWGDRCGTGSTEAVTRDYRAFIQKFLTDNAIGSVVDIGCGDWRIGQLLDWTGIDYVGIDVSRIVLSSLSRFEKPNVRFRVLDATRDALPPGDLLIAKDVLQHWSNAAILRFMEQLPRFRFALLTNGFLPQRDGANEDIVDGNWRSLDLKAAPFALAGDYVFAYMADEPKRMFLWRNSQA